MGCPGLQRQFLFTKLMQWSYRTPRVVSGVASDRTEVTNTNLRPLGVQNRDSWYSLVLKFLAWVLISGCKILIKWFMVAEVLSRLRILCEFSSCSQSISFQNQCGSVQQMSFLSWNIINSQTRFSMFNSLQFKRMIEHGNGKMPILPSPSPNTDTTTHQKGIDINVETMRNMNQMHGSFDKSNQKEKVMQVMRGKLVNLQKLLPVRRQHITYIRSELIHIIDELLQEKKELLSKDSMDLMRNQLITSSSQQINKIQDYNSKLIEKEMKEYLHSHVIELYPTLISLQLPQFQTKYQQKMQILKQQYEQHFISYFNGTQQSQRVYCLFMDKENNKIFLELVRRWKHGFKDIEAKLEEAGKKKRMLEEEVGKMKQEQRKSSQHLEDFRRQEGRSYSNLKTEMEQTYKNELMTLVTEYQVKLRSSEQTRQTQIGTLKQKMGTLQKERQQILTSTQHQKRSMLQKVAVQQQKSDHLTLKFQQLKNYSELQIEQLKCNYEGKLKIAELKHSQAINMLNSQRRKFQKLTQERRIEETQIMEELQIKNYRIQELSQELMKLEGKYRYEMESILNEEKQILVRTISDKIQKSEHKCKIYEEQVQTLNATIEKYRNIQIKHQSLQVQMMRLKEKSQEDVSQIKNLRKMVGRLEEQLIEQGLKADEVKQKLEKQLNFKKKELKINQQKLKEVQRKLQGSSTDLNQRIQQELTKQKQQLANRQTINLKLNRAIVEQKLSKQRDQLKKVLTNSYEELQNLKNTISAYDNQINRVHLILKKIRDKYQSIRQTSRQSQSSPINEQIWSETQDLIRISESPEEESNIQGGEGNEKDLQFLADQIDEIFRSMSMEVHFLSNERTDLKEKLNTHIKELTGYDKIFNQSKDQIQAKMSQLQKQNYHLKKDVQLKDQTNSKRDIQLQANIQAYKNTISNVTDENRKLSIYVKELTSSNSELNQELERFRIWAEMKSQSSQKDQWSSKRDRSITDNSTGKIKDLESQLKQMIQKVQEERASGRQKQPLVGYRKLQFDHLRKQNELLYQKLRESHLNEFKMVQRSNKQNLDKDSSLYISIKEEYNDYKYQSRQAIEILQAQLKTHVEEKDQLQRQLRDLETNLNRKYLFDCQMMTEDIRNLQLDRERNQDNYTQKIAILQQSLSNKVNETDRKLAQTQIRFDKERQKLEKDRRQTELQGERHRLKYQQLLKVNKEVMREADQLRGRAHQTTLRDKYREKIAQLFVD